MNHTTLTRAVKAEDRAWYEYVHRFRLPPKLTWAEITDHLSRTTGQEIKWQTVAAKYARLEVRLSRTLED